MRYKRLELDCNGLTEHELNKMLKNSLGFVDWYGMNWDAMIDCLSLMRYPNEGMSDITLEDDEILIIECKSLSKAKFDVNTFIGVIETVNEKEISKGNNSQIQLTLIS